MKRYEPNEKTAAVWCEAPAASTSFDTKTMPHHDECMELVAAAGVQAKHLVDLVNDWRAGERSAPAQPDALARVLRATIPSLDRALFLGAQCTGAGKRVQGLGELYVARHRLAIYAKNPALLSRSDEAATAAPWWWYD